MTRARPRLWAVPLVAIGCGAPGGPGAFVDPAFYPPSDDAGRAPSGGAAAPAPTADAAVGPDAPAVAAKLVCVPVKAQALPPRIDVVSARAATSGLPAPAMEAPRDTTMFTADLFSLFRSHCGGCHVDTKLGNFQATARTFTKVVDRKVVDTMKSDNPAVFMPPPAGGGKAWSQRKPDDPVVALVKLLELWLAQNRPDDLFTIPAERKPVEPARPEEPSAPSYLLDPESAGRMSNLGDCVVQGPLAELREKPMQDLDAFFARATELPDNLAATDLISLDGETLARHRVIPFAPTYPLFSDDAAKIRHVRVPHGQSIRFDKARQEFDIPANTRFYKTFLKEVTDRSGKKSYRKIETRLILSRPDRKLPDGTFEVASLFGTYIWNDEETEARLLRDPLRNGQPFRDRMLTYIVDEPKVKKILDANPSNKTFALEEENTGLLRRYAIPSAERCLQCHMGSGSSSFILGFSPLQVVRRPVGTGGVIEAAGEHELDQLGRLVANGVITGISSPEDILPLERSQGERKPRNEHELVAQGYLLGNCASCHNPRGFASVKNSDLKEVLDFLPSAAGGIFQFPLERTSPVRKRGAEQDIPMPYITPSLREYPVGESATPNWTPKWASCSDESWVLCSKRKPGPGAGTNVHLDAPWRSLIYRNVETPFTYADDFVIFPRMPMHVPGFDCRAPRILGDWMVSIPAVRKNPAIPEDAVPGGKTEVDRSPQPYQEVRPGEPGYEAAVAEAAKRLTAYHEGGRYAHCPEGADIVERGEANKPPIDAVFDPKDPEKVLMPNVGVPVRSHWVVTDLTDAPGDWYPRRPDWAPMIVDGKPEDTGLADAARRQQRLVAEVLTGKAGDKPVAITPELRAFALAHIPFGLWQEKPGCDLSTAPRLSSFEEGKRWRWMRGRPGGAAPAGEAPVYTQSVGAAVFANICVNCHGPQADSKGLMAEAIMMLSGGEARVANLKDGLFGPRDKPGANRARVFGQGAAAQMADDLSARYFVWMALGGTQRQIPAAVLNIVGTTRVLGAQRRFSTITPTTSPNMLELAKNICEGVLTAYLHRSDGRKLADVVGQDGVDLTSSGLIEANADGEMWQRLCAIGNRRMVRVARWDDRKESPILDAQSFYWGDAYPADAPVLDHAGRVVKGLGPDNHFPLCVRQPAEAAERTKVERWLDANRVNGAAIPTCPGALFEPDARRWQHKIEYDAEKQVNTYPDIDRWALRGAANAGIAVFLYLDEVSKGRVKPQPAYNRCEELRK